MIFLQCPGGEIFIHRENKSCIGRLIIKEFFKFDGIAIFLRDQCFYLCPNLLFGFSKRHAAINKDDSRIGHSINGWCLYEHITNSDLAMTKERMVAELGLEVTDARDDRKQFIN